MTKNLKKCKYFPINNLNWIHLFNSSIILLDNYSLKYLIKSTY
jgi:hypothetical protein